MKILVTGASGFVGQALVPALLADGHVVLALTRRDLPFFMRHSNLALVSHDLSCPLEFHPEFEKIDVIVHLAQANPAAPANAPYVCRVNTQSTVDLLELGREAKIKKFIFASTGDVYKPKYGPCQEDDLVGPSTIYGYSKYCAELLCSGFAKYFEVCVLRLFHPYGPGQRDRLIPRLTHNIMTGRHIAVNHGAHPYVSPLYISDVVRAVVRSLYFSAPQIILNIAGREIINIQDLALRIGRILNKEPVFTDSGLHGFDSAGVNIRMREFLGVDPGVDLATGLEMTVWESCTETSR